MFSARPGLRLLLSLVLVLNGVGTSVAMTRMGLEHATHATTQVQRNAQATRGADSAGCQHGDTSALGLKSGATFSDSGLAKSPPPDCCKTKCDSACLQATPAAVMMSLVQGVYVLHVLDAPIISQAYPAPEHSDLNRPPIG